MAFLMKTPYMCVFVSIFFCISLYISHMFILINAHKQTMGIHSLFLCSWIRKLRSKEGHWFAQIPTVTWSFPGGASGKEPTCQCKRPGFDPWGGEIPWKRAGQLTSVFLPGESPWTQEPGGLQPMGSQRVGHNWATKHSTAHYITQCRKLS